HRVRRRERRLRALTFPWKNRCLAEFAAGIRRLSAKSGEGVRGGGACFPVRQLVKKTFLDNLKKYPTVNQNFLDSQAKSV
ncbi:MAG: hypothetical protein PUD50_14775, partial [Eubacteriales bacterium]|nr:hypothetical protein [Eubacteriales bacterium]